MIPSLLDNDLYKFSMCQAALHNFPGTNVEYEFVCRDDTDLTPYADEIRFYIHELASLRFGAEELGYLRSIRYISGDFVDYLRSFRLYPQEYVSVWNDKGKLRIRVKGPWVRTIFFEVPILAIVSQVYFRRHVTVNSVPTTETNIAKICSTLKANPSLKVADFGTRRRASFAIQEKLLTAAHDLLTGTSNVYFAKELNMKPIGTMAHEWIQAGQGMSNVQLRYSQQYMLESWIKEYRGDLGIALTDTISTAAFLNDFDLYLAKLYDGVRHDSGDPFVWGDNVIEHYKRLGIDPKSKQLVFSDSLTLDKAIAIKRYFDDRAKVSFGIGTNLTNITDVAPLSIVLKLTKVNGNPVAKLSNNPEKTICKDEGFLKYLKQVYKVDK